MDKDLYEALQEAAQRKRGNCSVLSPNGKSVKDRKAFNHLVLALHKLRALGLVKFRDTQVSIDTDSSDYSYDGIIC